MGGSVRMKVFIVIALFVGCTWAQYHHPEPVYHEPVYHEPKPVYHEEKQPPKPYVYEYGGVDYNNQAFAKTESQDEYGVVKGEYRVELPDGRTQIVTYHADHENGFVADVKYEGEAKPYVHEPKPYKPPHRPVHLPPAPYHEPAPPAYPYPN